MERTILCCDIGTSSIKVALFDESANILTSKKMFYEEVLPNLWIRSLATLCGEIFKQFNNVELAAISISGNGPTIVTQKKIFLWNTTPRYKKYSGPSIFIPKLLTVKNNYPAIWEDSPLIFSGPEYLAWQLTANAITVLPEERFSVAYWTAKDLHKYNINSEKIPPFINLTDSIGKLLPSAADKINIPQKIIPPCGTEVFCASSDFIASLIGTNTLYPGAANNRTGTSEGINLCTSKPIKHKKIRTLPSLHPTYYNSSVLIEECGAKLTRFKSKAYSNLSYEHTLSQMLSDNKNAGYKFLEKLAKNVRHNIKILQKEAIANNEKPISSLTVSGGQTETSKIMQLKSDILGLPLTITNCPNTELMGNFIVATTGLKYYSDIFTAANQLVKISRIFEPHKDFN